MNPLFTVSVRHRFWPWPKTYRCTGMTWGAPPYPGNPATHTPPDCGLPNHVLILDMPDHSRVFIDTTGCIVTYGPEVWAWKVQQMEKQAGQPLGIKG